MELCDMLKQLRHIFNIKAEQIAHMPVKKSNIITTGKAVTEDRNPEIY